MKKLFLVLFLLCHSSAFGQIEVESYRWNAKIVFNSLNISDATADSSSWIYIGSSHWFNAFFSLSTDSSFFVDAIADSLGFDVDYEIYHGYSSPDGDTQGFRPKTTLTQTELASFTISDTTFVNTYQSMHTISDLVGTLDISPGVWIRFFINKDAIHKKATASINFLMYLLTQS